MSGPLRAPSDSELGATRRCPVEAPPGYDDLAPTARHLILVPPPQAPSDTPLTRPQAAAPNVAFPETGTRLLHFELVEELGRGAFARVYVARQEALANRLVVLKVTTEHSQEPQNLARLRHTNIVPVYSVHESGPFQVLCMPYLGRVTLGRAVAGLAASGTVPTAGRDLLRFLGAESADHELTRMSYADACLWLVGELAAGLAHAHAAGLLHRDIKPANILFTEYGRPLLLDFNVAAAAGRPAPNAPVGGTLPYMAPEHLRAFAGQDARVDERSDLFSLGVILYQLLTGELPYPATLLPDRQETLRRMTAGRAVPAPSVRDRNPAVTPTVASIVAKLLEPSPGDRYPSAELLCEDVARQLSHRPLAFAPDRSLRERARKWHRRRPRLATGLAVAAAALLLLVLPVAAVANRQARLAEQERASLRAEAARAADDAVRELEDAAARLGSLVDPGTRAEGLRGARAVVGRYGVAEDGWQTRPAFARLDPERQAKLTGAFAEVLVLMTRAEAAAGNYSPAAVADGLRWNALAADLFPADARPAVLDRHRAELGARLAGSAPPAVPAGTGGDTDLYYDGLDLAALGRHRAALPLLAAFCDRHPTHFRAWFARGRCEGATGLAADAAASFTACLALRPDFPDAVANRGAARYTQGRHAEAEADFTRALELRPNWVSVLLNRGLARFERGRFAAAEADWTAALAGPDAPTRLYFLRSNARVRAGNFLGAALDRAEGMTRDPGDDALSWATRGRVRMDDEPEEAVADFDAALALDDGLKDALVNKASALADLLHREADAIPVLDRLVDLYPENADARCSRGVYFARLGRAAEARRDAAAALAIDPSAYRKFQVAGLHAQLAKKDAAAKADALRYLALALRAGFADAALLAGDADLDPVRGDDEFKRLVNAAAEVAPRPRR